ncbi:MAG: GH92 family glycosyl hydrolase [Marinifilaceae bacterium]
MKHWIKYSVIAMAGVVSACGGDMVKEKSVTEYIDPFIGTAGHGHTFPGAIVPFGGIQVSPDNPRSDWDWCSGYHYSDSIINSFSHTHLSGTGIGDLQDIRLMPTLITPQANQSAVEIVEQSYAKYSHNNEEASAGYYSVQLDNGIKAQLSATPRCAIHVYTFPQQANKAIVIDLLTARNWDRTLVSSIKQTGPRTIEGTRFSRGWASDQKVYFVAEFSQDITSLQVGKDSLKVVAPGEGVETERGVYAWVNFGPNGNEVIGKVSISSASIQGARANLAQELPHWDLNQVRNNAVAQWQKELSKIKVKGGNEDDITNFYTALYHAYTAPYLFNDVLGQYKGNGGKVDTVKSGNQYTVFSLWDTFRTAHPLFTITQTERVPDMINSMIRHYNNSGLLPVWELVGNETNCMIGHHGISVIAEAVIKEIPGFDYEEAYQAAKASALHDRDGLKELRQYGYIPSDLVNESVSKTLEYCYNFHCVARMAEKLGHKEDQEMFEKLAQTYRNHFDSKTGFMRGKTSKGEWREPFSPYYSNHREDDYTEGNAWQYSWYVPHDVEGLVALHGGAELFETKLDSLFTVPSQLLGDNASPDISGLVGQYAHGNEPSHHTIYLYNYIGKPHKTQYYTNHVLTTLYHPTPEGLCGNEDCGQMSAWYVMTAMGMYPVSPVDAQYQLTAPLFGHIEMNIDNGKKFVIKANKDTDKHIYIKEVKLNGKTLDRLWITHNEVINGGTLEYTLTTTPNE